MKKILTTLSILIIVCISLLFLIRDMHVAGKWHYKTTVVVSTPEGDKVGSGVRAVSNMSSKILRMLPHTGNSAHLEGEAVWVDLDDRGVLFFLITDSVLAGDFYYAFPPSSGKPTTDEGIRYYNKLKDGEKTVPISEIPNITTMVMFEDLKKPLSVGRVNLSNVEKKFGEGVYIKEYKLEITQAPVTRGIEDILPWLSDLEGRYINGDSNSSGAPLGLHEGHFIRFK